MRALTLLPILVLIGLGVWLYRGRISPEARSAQSYAETFDRQLRADARFARVEVGVWKLGSKGPLYLRGRVGSDADVAELHRKFETLYCPLGVSWQVVVDTNLTK